MTSTKNNPLVLALCLALLIISAFYILLTTVGNGATALVEGDQIIYLQYARNIALGHPYVFSPGDAPSTGSTSYLYPLVLAALYKLGATGDTFITAAYALNSLFYLGIIALVWLIAKKMEPRVAVPATFMAALSGHAVSAVLHQTDVGLFALLALGLFASILYGRPRASLALAILCGITRPEGFVFAVAFFLCGGASLLLNRRFPDTLGTKHQARTFLLLGTAGASAFLFTLFANHLLTGYAQFMSVANKGYFNKLPFMGAVEGTLYDALSLIKGVFFGLSGSVLANRQFYLFPLIGGLLALSGIMLHPRKEKGQRLCECWLLLAAGAVVLTIASSEYQGLSNDRYFAWIFPIWMLYAMIGTFELHERLGVKLFFPMMTTLLMLFQLVSLVFAFSNSYTSAAVLENKRAFAIRIDKETPANARLGSVTGASLNYFMPQHKIYNLSGITSPDFFEPKFDIQTLRIIDQLKHQPKLRFEYWMTYDNFLDSNPWATPFFGETKLIDNDSATTGNLTLGIYEARWDTLDGGDTPQLIQTGSCSLVDSLDIGYFDDETSHGYHYYLRLKNMSIPLCIMTAKLGTNDYSEVGRIILGNESFSLRNVSPDKPLRIVLRTTKKAKSLGYSGSHLVKIDNLELEDHLALRLFVDSQEVPCPTLDIGQEGFSEIELDVPETYLKTSHPRIMVVGDHISFAYWFYQ